MKLDPQTGFYPTLNGMGGMSPTLDRYSQAFTRSQGPLLDVGAAYGAATLAALERGAVVWANDLDPQHLRILSEAVPPQHRTRLKLVPGRFPGAIPWQPDSLGGVLLARVLAYLTGQEITEGLRQIHRSLRSGGRVFGVCVTPFLARLGEFQPVLEERRRNGDPWPGYVSDVTRYDAAIGPSMHFLDAPTLERALTGAGFQVETLEYFSRAEHARHMASDGREAVGFIARKE